MRNFTEDLRWAQDVEDGAIAGVLTSDWQNLEHLSISKSPVVFKPSDIVYVGAHQPWSPGFGSGFWCSEMYKYR